MDFICIDMNGSMFVLTLIPFYQVIGQDNVNKEGSNP